MDKISGFAGTISLGDLISENITIPYYQRPYVWDTERVKILLEDLDAQMSDSQKSAESNGQKYLLGSLILCENKENCKFEVVDGQQRLVTLALILLYLEKLKNGENATIDFLKGSRFQHSESKAHIKDNYKSIKSWFESKPDIWDNENLKSKIEFIYVVAPSLDDAFIFFDSANAKGKRLEAYDLIKAFHLRALEDYNPKSKDKDSNVFAREFERLAKENEGKYLKMLFNDILTPARQWLRDKSNKIPSQMDIYEEFCTDIPRNFEKPRVTDKNQLGILQNFVGGADFFEYISHFDELYKFLKDFDFYQWFEQINWSKGFTYNRYIYIMSALIYLDKFLDIDRFKCSKKYDMFGVECDEYYNLRLIARAVFTLRCSEERISIKTARDFAKEILPLIYYERFDLEVELKLKRFIIEYTQKEKTLYKNLQLDTKTIPDGGGTKTYLDHAKEKCYGDDYGNLIPLHYAHLYKTSQGEQQ